MAGITERRAFSSYPPRDAAKRPTGNPPQWDLGDPEEVNFRVGVGVEVEAEAVGEGACEMAGTGTSGVELAGEGAGAVEDAIEVRGKVACTLEVESVDVGKVKGACEIKGADEVTSAVTVTVEVKVAGEVPGQVAGRTAGSHAKDLRQNVGIAGIENDRLQDRVTVHRVRVRLSGRYP